MVEITLITTTRGQNLFSRTGLGASKLTEIRTIIANDGSWSTEEISEFVKDCETLRHKTKQAIRSNSPHSILQGFQREGNDQKQPCALLFRDSDGAIAFMFARIQYDRIQYVLKPFKMPANWLTTLIVRRNGFVHDGSATTFAAVTKWVSWLFNNRLIDRIQLTGVDSESPWFQYLTTSGHNQWRFFTIPRPRWQTRLIDPETGQRLKHHSTKTRQNFERQGRVLLRHFHGDVVVKSIVSVNELDYFIREASKIVDQTYQAAIGIGVRANDEEQRTYLYKLAEEGILRAYLLVAKGEAISYVLGTLQSDTFYAWALSYLPAYSNLSPGTVLLQRVMDLLVKEGTLIFDLGTGESNYKRMLGSHQINEVDIRLYARRLQPTINYVLDLFFKWLNERIIKLLTTKKDILNTLRQKWRKILSNKDKK